MKRIAITLVGMLLVPVTVYAQVKAGPFGDVKVSARIDAEILAGLKEEKLTPAAAASDFAFVRRVYLDLLGRIPTADEAAAYLDDKGPEKRRRLVEALLGHWEMPAAWSDVLHVWMNGRSPDPGFGYKEFREYLRSSLDEDKSWDKICRELLLPAKDGPTQPAAFFLGTRLGRENKEDQLDGMTVAVASTFFGVRMECAKCHDHPYVDEWKQEHYYGLAAFLNRTEAVNTGGKRTLRERVSGEVVFSDRKRLSHTAKVMFLDNKVFAEPEVDVKGKKIKKDPAPGKNRREWLADHALVPGNPYFKRALVNRMWKHLMGVGLVEPVDQIHSGNEPSHPKLFDLLAEDFAGHGFDLKRLIAVIMQSDAYARTSAWPGKERPMASLHAVFNMRALTPEQLSLSIATATGYSEVLKASKKKSEPKEIRAELEKDYKLFIENYESESDAFAATTGQALFMTFNKATQKHLQPGASNLVARLTKLTDNEAVAHLAYLAILSRRPTAAEVDDVVKHLLIPGVPRQELCREIAWAILNSAEFRFNS